MAKHDFKLDTPIAIPDDNNELALSKLELKEGKTLISSQELDSNFNPYLILLNRLDEEEGIRAPSVEDKLKKAEHQIQLSTKDFCSACEKLIGLEEQDKSKVYEYLQPSAVWEALCPKVFKPNLQTSLTLDVKEYKREVDKEKDKDTLQKENATKKKIAYYTSPDTWFDQGKHEEQITQEELELLNSTSTKAFLKFLKDRKKEPPKIIQDIQKKIADMKKENKS